MLVLAAIVVVRTGDTATTVIAALGLALALVSIAWQAWSFRQSGSRVKVEILSGLSSGVGIVLVAGAAPVDQLDQLRAQGFTTPIIAVRAVNAGRGATSVTSVGVHYEGGASFENPAVMDPPLPFRLEGEHEQTWRFDGTQVTAYGKALMQTTGTGRVIRGRVQIAGREKAILSQNLIELAPNSSG